MLVRAAARRLLVPASQIAVPRRFGSGGHHGPTHSAGELYPFQNNRPAYFREFQKKQEDMRAKFESGKPLYNMYGRDSLILYAVGAGLIVTFVVALKGALDMVNNRNRIPR